MKALVVEDDGVIADQLAVVLRRQGFQVEAVPNGLAALDEVYPGSHDLIVLDLMLPGLDGLAVCRQLRARRVGTPILMLTARDTVEDRVRGLEEGADDYLPKPFDVREFEARVRALMRRDKVHRTGRIVVADLEIDTRARRVTRAGTEIDLTPREYDLLVALAANEGRTLTRQVILDSVWSNEDCLEGTVNFHITSLRRKVDAGREPKLIHTVYGIGYSMRVRSGDADA